MISFLIYSKINDEGEWKKKKLHTTHQLYLFKPVTLVRAFYFVFVCVCVCVCARTRERVRVYLVDQGSK